MEIGSTMVVSFKVGQRYYVVLKALRVRLDDGSCGTVEVRYGDAPRRYQEPAQAEECAAWLVDEPAEAGTPVPSKEVYERAREAGFRKAAVYRARETLHRIVVETHRWRSLRSLSIVTTGGGSFGLGRGAT